MGLHDLANELLEIRRYVRSHPEHVTQRFRGGLAALETVLHMPERDFLRMGANIRVGLDRIVVDPEILEGYLYGAAAEIREQAIKQEDGK